MDGWITINAQLNEADRRTLTAILVSAGFEVRVAKVRIKERAFRVVQFREQTDASD